MKFPFAYLTCVVLLPTAMLLKVPDCSDPQVNAANSKSKCCRIKDDGFSVTLFNDLKSQKNNVIKHLNIDKTSVRLNGKGRLSWNYTTTANFTKIDLALFTAYYINMTNGIYEPIDTCCSISVKATYCQISPDDLPKVFYSYSYNGSNFIAKNAVIRNKTLPDDKQWCDMKTHNVSCVIVDEISGKIIPVENKMEETNDNAMVKDYVDIGLIDTCTYEVHKDVIQMNKTLQQGHGTMLFFGRTMWNATSYKSKFVPNDSNCSNSHNLTTRNMNYTTKKDHFLCFSFKVNDPKYYYCMEPSVSPLYPPKIEEIQKPLVLIILLSTLAICVMLLIGVLVLWRCRRTYKSFFKVKLPGNLESEKGWARPSMTNNIDDREKPGDLFIYEKPETQSFPNSTEAPPPVVHHLPYLVTDENLTNRNGGYLDKSDVDESLMGSSSTGCYRDSGMVRGRGDSGGSKASSRATSRSNSSSSSNSSDVSVDVQQRDECVHFCESDLPGSSGPQKAFFSVSDAGEPLCDDHCDRIAVRKSKTSGNDTGYSHSSSSDEGNDEAENGKRQFNKIGIESSDNVFQPAKDDQPEVEVITKRSAEQERIFRALFAPLVEDKPVSFGPPGYWNK